MRNQIRSLQSILFVLLVILGINAFTTPSQVDTIVSEITEGKIQAAEQNYIESLMPQYLQAQQDFRKMNIDFNEFASKTENEFDSLPQLSLISQILYVYEQEMKEVKFHTLTLEKRKAWLAKLTSIKNEFYKTFSYLTDVQSGAL